MNMKQFQRFIFRDVVMVDAGRLDDTAVPQHRLGRKMGGSKLRDNPANIITFSSAGNNLMEIDASYRAAAYKYGWTLREGDDPRLAPVYHVVRGWIMLDDEFRWRTATKSEVADWRDHASDYRYA